MPFNVPAVVALIAVILGIMTWWKTKRIGPVVTVAVIAFIIILLADPSFLETGAAKVGDFFNWAFGSLTL